MPTRILGGIYLLSIESINAGVDLKEAHGIEHILSVLSGPVPESVKGYDHLHIDIEDQDNADLLLRLPECLAFMDKALFLGLAPEDDKKKHTGSVLVHCAQGCSRSVAVVTAYLMYRYKLTYDQALHAVRRKVAGARPNEGFVQQIQLFRDMGFKVDPSHKPYRQWVMSMSLLHDPSGGELRRLGLWQDSASRDAGSGDIHLRCKRCRSVLASDLDLTEHEVPDLESRQSQFVKKAAHSRRIILASEGLKTCSHYFVEEPLPWMRQELEKEDIEGKFVCPKCESKVGGYSWKGLRCSCGKWMVPALHLQTAKVDAMKAPAK